MKIITAILLFILLLGVMPAHAQQPDVNGAVRLVANPDFVVSLLPDGSLHYYFILKNSTGYLVGFTPPGWRNDTLPPRLIDRVTRDTLTVELYNLGGGRYAAILTHALGVQLVRAEFAGAGPVGSGVIVRIGTTEAVTTAGTTPANTLTTTTTTSSSSRDNGVASRAQGSFDGTFYTVAAGDNLYRIALRFNTTFGVLMAANGISNPNQIYVGQRIRIP